MIDGFAGTHPVDASIELTHRRGWEKGNKEEGYLLGLDSLVETFAAIQKAEDAT